MKEIQYKPPYNNSVGLKKSSRFILLMEHLIRFRNGVYEQFMITYGK